MHRRGHKSLSTAAIPGLHEHPALHGTVTRDLEEEAEPNEFISKS